MALKVELIQVQRPKINHLMPITDTVPTVLCLIYTFLFMRGSPSDFSSISSLKSENRCCCRSEESTETVSQTKLTLARLVKYEHKRKTTVTVAILHHHHPPALLGGGGGSNRCRDLHLKLNIRSERAQQKKHASTIMSFLVLDRTGPLFNFIHISISV